MELSWNGSGCADDCMWVWLALGLLVVFMDPLRVVDAAAVEVAFASAFGSNAEFALVFEFDADASLFASSSMSLASATDTGTDAADADSDPERSLPWLLLGIMIVLYAAGMMDGLLCVD